MSNNIQECESCGNGEQCINCIYYEEWLNFIREMAQS